MGNSFEGISNNVLAKYPRELKVSRVDLIGVTVPQQSQRLPALLQDRGVKGSPSVLQPEITLISKLAHTRM